MFNNIPELIKAPSKDDPLYLYLIVNKDLNMSSGKIGGQIGHAIQYFMEYLFGIKFKYYFENAELNNNQINLEKRYYHWKCDDKVSKIVLTANTKEFNKIKEEYNPIVVVDAGHTEIVAGSETVICLYPMFKSERSGSLKRLRLLK